MQDISEWCMLGSKGADYINPETFNKAWNHQDKNERCEWRNTIQKEIGNMTKREVGHKAKKN